VGVCEELTGESGEGMRWVGENEKENDYQNEGRRWKGTFDAGPRQSENSITPMKTSISRLARFGLAFSMVAALATTTHAAFGGWKDLFDGKTLAGWRASEHPEAFKVAEGAIVADGDRAHLFYVGEDGKAEFENFELEVEVKTMAHANSGVFFHTAWQDEGWPAAGFEVQVNNSQKPFEVGQATGNNAYRENKKTGSLYGVRNVYRAMARDGEWFTMKIKVQRPRVQTWVNDVLVTDYIEPANELPEKAPALNRLGKGTFALQCHDPHSKVFYRKVRVKKLPDGVAKDVKQPEWNEQDVRLYAMGKENVPIVDLHTHLKGDLTLEKALAVSRATGMGLGIATNGGQGFPIQNDAAALAFLETMKGQPVFLALQAEGREWMKMFTPEAYSKFDYIFTDAMTWTNKAGKRLRLWIPEESEIGDDPEAFMEELVEQTVKIIETEPIDIYVNPLFLPDSLAAKAKELWTIQRMQRIVAALAKHRVAVEINARYKIPSEEFVRLAKSAGVKFTIGTNNTMASDWGNWAYPVEIAKKTGLEWRDFWVPGHEASRAQRLVAEKK